jgi:predicted alpha/beta superfamily hydrolase
LSSPSLSRRNLLGTAGAFAASSLIAPPARAAEGWHDVVLPKTQQREFTSSITGKQHRIFISVPSQPAPPGGHPVLFALDGNATFPTLALMARMAGWRHASGTNPPVVVGIGYPGEFDYGTARGRDYTPPSGVPGDKTGASGGVDLFLDFIERELKPMVVAVAPIDPARQALFGHSYGGLCTLYALFNRPAMFQTYLAGSPSIWYGERAILSSLQGFEQRLARLPARPALMLSVGELEQPAAGAKPAQGRDASAAARRMVDDARELAERLRKMNVLSRRQPSRRWRAASSFSSIKASVRI